MPRKITYYQLRGRRNSLNRLGISVRHYNPYLNANGEVGFHRHDVIEMTFVVRGTAKHCIREKEYPEQPGSLGIIHYDESHVFVTPPKGTEIYDILLDPRDHPLPMLPGRLGNYLPMIIPLHPFLRHNLNRITHLQFPDPAPVAALLSAIVHEQRARREEHDEAIFSYYRLFLMECARLLQRRKPAAVLASDPPTMAAMEALRRRLDRDYTQPHTLTGIARECGYDKSYLCRAFRKHTGISIFQYLLRQRLQAAMLMLRSTKEKVLSVALECGFGDIGHFNRKFKALVGVSPRAYRQRFRAT